MRLKDKVEILEADGQVDAFGNLVVDWNNPTVVAEVPAYVGHVSAEVVGNPGSLWLKEQLRVIIGPFPFDPIKQRIRWRGELYENDGPPMVRLKNGVEHHLTIAIRKLT